MNFTPATPAAKAKHKNHYFESVRRPKRKLAGDPQRKKGRPKGSKNRLKGTTKHKKGPSKSNAKRKDRLTSTKGKAKKPRKASVWDTINSGIKTSGQVTSTTTTDGTPYTRGHDIQTTRPVEPVTLAGQGAPTEAPVIVVTPEPLAEVPPQVPREDDNEDVQPREPEQADQTAPRTTNEENCYVM